MMPGYACGWCGEEFVPARSDALYCSGRCRVAAHRAGPGKGAAGSPAPVATVPMAQANVSLAADLLAAIDAAAKARGITRSAFVADAARARIALDKA